MARPTGRRGALQKIDPCWTGTDAWVPSKSLASSLQLVAPISWPLTIIAVTWSPPLFRGYGLLSRVDATVVATLALGSFAVASAIFPILELNRPYTGLFRISPAVVMRTLEAMGE